MTILVQTRKTPCWIPTSRRGRRQDKDDCETPRIRKVLADPRDTEPNMKEEQWEAGTVDELLGNKGSFREELREPAPRASLPGI